MTILEYAGARLATAVAHFLADRDASALKLAFSEYMEAKARHNAAVAANDLQDDDQ